MLTVARLPQNDMPMASSIAVFSLLDQWECSLRSRAIGEDCTYSRISVDGVPG